MTDDFLNYVKTETDILKLKKTLIIYDFINNDLKKENSVYKFYLNMLNLGLDFDYFDKPLVSIIIPVKNEFLLTQFILNSIYTYTQNIPYEIILADDNSEDRTKEIEKIFTNIKVVKNDINTPGFLYNVTNAINYARSEYILLLNNDMLVWENYLPEMLKVIQNHSEIGIVGAKNLSLDNTINECGVNIKDDYTPSYIGERENQDYLDDKEYIDCDYCSGCSILFKKETWDKAGGFDKNLAPAYYEDSDFALNVKYNLGLKSVCVPRAKIYHFKNMSYNGEAAKRVAISKRNKEYFINKWKDVINK